MATLPGNTTQSNNDFLEDEYQNLKTLIFKYDEAISAVLTGGHAAYQLDTGQSSQQVTRFNLSTVQDARAKLVNEFNALAARLRKTAAVKMVIPGY